MCTWVNSPNVLEDEFDWTRGSGSTPSNFTGPLIDHTTGTKKGHILFLSPYVTSVCVFPELSTVYVFKEIPALSSLLLVHCSGVQLHVAW